MPASSDSVVPVFLNPYATVSVKSHMLITLELKNPNYTMWTSFFKSMCGKFGIMSYIDGTAPRPTDPAWIQADCCIRSWLFGSVAVGDMLDLDMEEEDQTAHDLWIAIKNLFHANNQQGATGRVPEP